MKNKKQLFSLLLLLSCSLGQKALFGAAAAGPALDEAASVYKFKIDAGGKKVGINFGELIRGLKTALSHSNSLLYNALIKLVRSSISKEAIPDNIKEEFKRLEDSKEIPSTMAIGMGYLRGNKEFTKEEVKNILWPLLVWAIEKDNADLVYELYPLIGDEKKPYGKKVTPRELANFLESKQSLKQMEAIEDFAKKLGS